MKQKQPNKRWPLTAKQQALYDYFVGEGKYHVTKTAEHFGRSLATIYDMLQRLVEKGWLVNEKGKSPAYRLVLGEDDIIRLARFMHNTYENKARLFSWETQERSRVAFEDLPPENAKTMLAVAKEVIRWFSKNPL